MQTFNEILLPDQTLYAINANGDICKLAISGEYKDTKNPYYLIGTDKIELIKYYIKRLDESIVYQNKVVNDGLDQIKQLQNTKDKLYEVIKSTI